jgi:excisionase family DNA binding protein
MNTSEQYFTVGDLVTRLQVSDDTIYRAIQRGELVAARFGRRGGYRVSNADLATWLVAKGQRQDHQQKHEQTT